MYETNARQNVPLAAIIFQAVILLLSTADAAVCHFFRKVSVSAYLLGRLAHLRFAPSTITNCAHCARASTTWSVANLICKDAESLSRGPRLFRRRQNTPRLCILLICRLSTSLILLIVVFHSHGTVNLPIGIQGIQCIQYSCRFFTPGGFQALWSQTTRQRYASHIP